MSPRPKRPTALERLRIFRQRSYQVPSYVLALLAVFVIALLATGIGYLLYRQ